MREKEAELAYLVLDSGAFSLQKNFHVVPDFCWEPCVPRTEAVPVREWLSRLRANDGDVRGNARKKPMDFWERKHGAIPN